MKFSTSKFKIPDTFDIYRIIGGKEAEKLAFDEGSLFHLEALLNLHDASLKNSSNMNFSSKLESNKFKNIVEKYLPFEEVRLRAKFALRRLLVDACHRELSLPFQGPYPLFFHNSSN